MGKKPVLMIGFILWGAIGLTDAVHAMADSVQVTVKVRIPPMAKIDWGGQPATFLLDATESASSAHTMITSATANGIRLLVRTAPHSPVSFHIRADGPDLLACGTGIPVNAISVKGTGDFQDVTALTASDQPLDNGAWVGSGVRSGGLSFSFTPAGQFPPCEDDYAQTVTFTLSAP